MMFWHDGGWSFWQVALMCIGMIAVFGLLIWALYALMVGIPRRPGGGLGLSRDNARQILDERLARDEINADQYRQLLEVIASGHDTSPVDAGSRR
jgi:putative membrane protein